MRIPPRLTVNPTAADIDNINEWLFELYTETNANIYKLEAVLEAPNGTLYQVTVDNDGNISAVLV